MKTQDTLITVRCRTLRGVRLSMKRYDRAGYTLVGYGCEGRRGELFVLHFALPRATRAA